ncbi:MAG TPA: ATP-dependent helicase [Caulobacteraceae bacterium]|nr:ATP-dependent helicase [Caulobacteraceae bacterium]
MQPTERQQAILAAPGHLLVTGGPGSGKTTVSILKAALIAEHGLRPAQNVLFVSFARATVSRVVEAIEYEQSIPKEQKRRIVVETYHSWFWRLLRGHGYLVGLPRRLSILTPPAEAIVLSTIRRDYPSEGKLTQAERDERDARLEAERRRLAIEEGRVCFDLFAPIVGDILVESDRIRQLVAAMYPFIILDEFQDTNAPQWRVVEAVGQHCTLLALADPEQRIYDFIGADPERMNHFRAAFAPTEVDLSTENHRSAGTEILLFANHALKGDFQQNAYVGVSVRAYEANANQAKGTVVTATYAARKRLVDLGLKDWSLAILVPTKRMTRLVSDALRSPPGGMAEVPHAAAIELEAAILAAEVIAFLMQPDQDGRHFERFLDLLRSYFRGRGGDSPSQKDLNEADTIRAAYADLETRRAARKEPRQNSVLVAILKT